MRVLFVDDDPVLRKLGDHALGELGGMSVVTAADGAEALAAVDRTAPDAILLDYLMPDMNGDAVLAILASSPATRNIPVVFLTGVDDEDELRQLLAAGAIGCLTKPFDPMTLAEDLKRVLRSAPHHDSSGS
ncbi:MAG: response regulator [Acidimicrobiia bacterium]|nr:MAG: response regulator [Acidimicrobiia bacterium]